MGLFISTISELLTCAEIQIRTNFRVAGGVDIIPSSLSLLSATLAPDFSSIVSKDMSGG